MNTRALHALKKIHNDTWREAYDNCCLGTDGVVTDEMIEKEFMKLLNDKEAGKC